MKSFANFLILAVFAFSAATALADDTNSSNAAPERGVRFDVHCDSGSIGAHADARIYKSWSDEENVSSIQPEWGGNLLAISIKGQLIYANDSAVYIVTDNNGHQTWQIQGVNTYPLIDLGDHPFSFPPGSPNPKHVDAIFDFGQGHHAPGTCDISRSAF